MAMSKGKKMVLTIIIGIFIVFGVISGSMMIYLLNGMSRTKSLVIADVPLDRIADGTYRGQFDEGRWANALDVKVENGKIAQITIVQDVKFNNPAQEQQLFDRVIEQQKVNVDVVSGATATSKALLKSIENALTQAP
jgi:uncharacterized protein with FMN-binding domain